MGGGLRVCIDQLCSASPLPPFLHSVMKILGVAVTLTAEQQTEGICGESGCFFFLFFPFCLSFFIFRSSFLSLLSFISYFLSFIFFLSVSFLSHTLSLSLSSLSFPSPSLLCFFPFKVSIRA